MSRRPPPMPPPVPSPGEDKNRPTESPGRPARPSTPSRPRPRPTGGPPAPASQEAQPPVIKPKSKIIKTDRMFGRFELLMEMARGGMATLYLARIRGPESFEKHLVIKKIHDHLAEEEEFIGMFLDEARITALIQHPNVATIFDMGQIDGSYFIAMEYVHGENLTSVLRAAVRQKRTFKWPYAAKIVADAAAGLHAAHELKGPEGKPLGVVHRDVSPQNILVSYDGHTKIVDFGIAYAAERISHTQAGTLKGKVSYMSPEQTSSRNLDRRSDVYSLGIVLFESVVLKRLFREKNEAAALLRIREGDIPKPRSIRPDIPEPLERIMLKALATDPEKRYQTAEELEDALNEFLVSRGHMVGHKRVAETMESLFYQRKKIKDEQVKRASEGSSDERPPMRGFGMAGTSTSLDAPPEGSAVQQSGGLSSFLKTAIVTAAVLAAALVVLVLILIFRGKEPAQRAPQRPIQREKVAHQADARHRQQTRPREEAMKPPPREEKPKTVTLRVVVLPKSASPTVTFKKKKHKGSIFQVVVKRSDEQEELTVTAPGYKKETVVLVPVENKELILTLTRRHKKARKPRENLLTLPE